MIRKCFFQQNFRRFFSIESKQALRDALQKRLDQIKSNESLLKNTNKEELLDKLNEKLCDLKKENPLLSNDLKKEFAQKIASKIYFKRQLSEKLGSLKDENEKLQQEKLHFVSDNISDQEIKTKFLNQHENNLHYDTTNQYDKYDKPIAQTKIYIVDKGKKSFFRQQQEQEPLVEKFARHQKKQKFHSQENATSETNHDSRYEREYSLNPDIFSQKDIVLCVVLIILTTTVLLLCFRLNALTSEKLVQADQTPKEMARLEKEIDKEIVQLQREIAKQERKKIVNEKN